MGKGDACPDDGGSTHLRNVGLLQQDYTALHPRRLYNFHTRKRKKSCVYFGKDNIFPVLFFGG
jgi:hypothetical protein